MSLFLSAHVELCMLALFCALCCFLFIRMEQKSNGLLSKRCLFLTLIVNERINFCLQFFMTLQDKSSLWLALGTQNTATPICNIALTAEIYLWNGWSLV